MTIIEITSIRTQSDSESEIENSYPHKNQRYKILNICIHLYIINKTMGKSIN